MLNSKYDDTVDGSPSWGTLKNRLERKLLKISCSRTVFLHMDIRLKFPLSKSSLSYLTSYVAVDGAWAVNVSGSLSINPAARNSRPISIVSGI